MSPNDNSRSEIPCILQEIIDRPGMFLVENSVYCLKAFLDGYLTSSPEDSDTQEFVEEFAAYIGGDTSTLPGRSWAKVLVGRTHDKYSALPIALERMKEFHLARSSEILQGIENRDHFSESCRSDLEEQTDDDKLRLPRLLQRIRDDPKSVLDETSIRSMRNYLMAIDLVRGGSVYVNRFLLGFDSWVASRYSLDMNLPWDRLIEIYSRDSHTAIDQAFQLMEEYVSQSK